MPRVSRHARNFLQLRRCQKFLRGGWNPDARSRVPFQLAYFSPLKRGRGRLLFAFPPGCPRRAAPFSLVAEGMPSLRDGVLGRETETSKIAGKADKGSVLALRRLVSSRATW